MVLNVPFWLRLFSLLYAMKSIMQLIILTTGMIPMRHPTPHVAIPPRIVEPPQPRNPSTLMIPDIKKNVFAVCSSVGINLS